MAYKHKGYRRQARFDKIMKKLDLADRVAVYAALALAHVAPEAHLAHLEKRIGSWGMAQYHDLMRDLDTIINDHEAIGHQP